MGVRDPAPPLFGPGFGVTEEEPGKPAFHWAGPAARLVVPGLEGPPVALVAGERDGDAGPTTLRVTDAATGALVLTRPLAPGPFELAIVPRTIYGPLSVPAVWILSCDHPKPLPRLEDAKRPELGCFSVLDATFSLPPEAIWRRLDDRFVLDVGSPSDRSADLVGFHARERVEPSGLGMRWTGGEASVAFSPVAGFVPRRLVLRARAPAAAAVPVRITVGGLFCGEISVRSGDFADYAFDFSEVQRDGFRGTDPVRIGLSSPTWTPRDAGRGTIPARSAWGFRGSPSRCAVPEGVAHDGAEGDQDQRDAGERQRELAAQERGRAVRPEPGAEAGQEERAGVEEKHQARLAEEGPPKPREERQEKRRPRQKKQERCASHREGLVTRTSPP